MAAIFSYGFEVADKNFADAGVPLVCLSNYDALLPQAVKENYINQSTLTSLAEWRKNPSGWMQ
jgi:orotate phosphoribosyltransferase